MVCQSHLARRSSSWGKNSGFPSPAPELGGYLIKSNAYATNAVALMRILTGVQGHKSHLGSPNWSGLSCGSLSQSSLKLLWLPRYHFLRLSSLVLMITHLPSHSQIKKKILLIPEVILFQRDVSFAVVSSPCARSLQEISSMAVASKHSTQTHSSSPGISSALEPHISNCLMGSLSQN